MLKAVSNVNQIIGPQLLERGFDVRDQAKIDRFLLDLDGTANKGINGLTPFSLLNPTGSKLGRKRNPGSLAGGCDRRSARQGKD